MEQSFEVIDVEASKVYKTEVEKQQNPGIHEIPRAGVYGRYGTGQN